MTNPTICFLIDIIEFYPSITEELLDRVIEWAKPLTSISDDEIAINIIKHVRKSLLFYEDSPWIKRNNESMFDVTMGNYDRAEICELVGHKNVGLYRNDGLALIKGANGQDEDTTRKMLHAFFQQIGLKITQRKSVMKS